MAWTTGVRRVSVGALRLCRPAEFMVSEEPVRKACMKVCRNTLSGMHC